MADPALVAAQEQRATNDIASMLEETGGPRAKARLETARRRSRKGNRALLIVEIREVLRSTLAGLVPDPTPIGDNLKGAPPGVGKLLKKQGIKTKYELKMTPDSELLSIPGIKAQTLKRIKDNL